MTEELSISDEERSQFKEAIAVANIPALLMTLVQLTGQRRWIEEPFRVRRAGGLGDNDTAGLPEDLQDEVKRAALDAILAWRAGKSAVLKKPSGKLCSEMLAWCVGEPIPEGYESIIEVELPDAETIASSKVSVPEGFEAVIIGAGVSGLCAAVNLKRAGIPFTIFEKSDHLGGTWLDNTYPGAGVDTPNHLYSYSFAPYDWSMYFALRDELQEYLDHVAEKFNLLENIRFGSEVEDAAFDNEKGDWELSLKHSDGSKTKRRAHAVIAAVGIFNPLKYPDIEGLGKFSGPCFHTAEWPKDLDLSGKRVAIIGNGASAMQVGPEIQNEVESLTIFQRSAHWVAPHEQFRKKIPEPIRFLLKEVPYYRAWYRIRAAWMFGDRAHDALQKDPSWSDPDRSLNKVNDAHRAYFTRYIVSELGERSDLLDKVVPTYPPFGKRLLMDNGWYKMLKNEKVNLVEKTIREISSDSVVTEDGTEHKIDILVIATGFDVLRFLTTLNVRGKTGESLREVWNDDDARAYLGTVIPGFPNFFTLYGPNLQAGHGGSFMFMSEMQVRYMMSVLTQMFEKNISTVDCLKSVHDEYNEVVDSRHEEMVWTHPGMETYYRNKAGRVVVNSPFRNAQFFSFTREAKMEDYEVTKAKPS